MFSGFYLLTNKARQLYSVQHIFIEQIFLNYSFFKNKSPFIKMEWETGFRIRFTEYGVHD